MVKVAKIIRRHLIFATWSWQIMKINSYLREYHSNIRQLWKLSILANKTPS